MKKLSITLAAAGLAMFCASQIAAQTSGAGGAVPPPSGSSTPGAAAGGNLGAPSLSQPAGESMSSHAGAGSSTMGGLQTQPALPPSGQPGAAMQSPSTLQIPLTAEGSGGNGEAGQSNGSLKGYGAGGSSANQAPQQNVQRVNPNDPRLVRFNNEWWYWMPGGYWTYYRNSNWNRYDPYGFQPLTPDTIRYQTGYRAPAGPVYYLDENGLRYRRFYAPEVPKGPALDGAQAQGNTQNSNSTQTNSNTEATIGGAVRGQQGPNVGAEIGGAVRNQ